MVIYNLIISLYRFSILLVSPFNQKAKKMIDGRKNWVNTVDLSISNSNVVWFHCASLGEYEQAKPLIQHFKSINEKILVTFFSPSGYERVKQLHEVDFVYYLPFDTENNAEKFVELINPSKIFFVKYELWYNMLDVAFKKNIPTYLISATFRKNHFVFAWYGKLIRNLLPRFNKVFVQDDESKKNLNKYGIDNVVVSGDTRFETVLQNKSLSTENLLIEAFKQDKILIVAGSCWEPEQEIMIKIADKFKDVKLIFAPHNISENYLTSLKSKVQNSIFYSAAKLETIKTYSSLIIDNIGLLKSIYSYADIVIVGGGYSNKLHNILEPAVFGKPVLFGNNVQKFHEAKLMIQHHAAYSLSNEKLIEKLEELIHQNELRTKVGVNAQQFITNNSGATKKILEVL